MNVRDEVDDAGVHPVLWLWLGVLALAHRHRTARPLTVTSLRRPPGDRPSKHSPPDAALVTAADVRRWTLDELGATESWCRMLQFEYGAYLGVVLEPEWLAPDEIAARGGLQNVDPHIHVQLKRTDYPEAL